MVIHYHHLVFLAQSRMLRSRQHLLQYTHRLSTRTDRLSAHMPIGAHSYDRLCETPIALVKVMVWAAGERGECRPGGWF